MLHHSGKTELGLLGLGGPKASPGALALGQDPITGKHLWKPVCAFSCWHWWELGSAGRSRDIFKAHFQGTASQPQWPGLRTPGPGLPLRRVRCHAEAGNWSRQGHCGSSCAWDESVSDGVLSHFCSLRSSCTLCSLITTISRAHSCTLPSGREGPHAAVTSGCGNHCPSHLGGKGLLKKLTESASITLCNIPLFNRHLQETVRSYFQ